MNKFNYKWYLSDDFPHNGIEKNNLKVFGSFICGGGSTMGYKLSGYNHLGGIEIDSKIAKIYKENHNPKYLFNQDIRGFLLNKNIPSELYELDILDGSPPCSLFSMSGIREEGWGIEKKFREGQCDQVLDDLFFEFIKLANKLRPKVVIAENVKGLIFGNAKIYVHKIKKGFNDAGYDVQLFLLNSASMGVPQARERVFFICSRKDLNFKKIKMDFNEKIIPYSEIEDDDLSKKIPNSYLKYWKICKEGKSLSTVHPKGSFFNAIKLSPNKVVNTISTKLTLMHYSKEKYLSKNELCLAGSYPIDYNFMNEKPEYLIGMSVPPVMMAQIALKIYEQWFKK